MFGNANDSRLHLRLGVLSQGAPYHFRVFRMFVFTYPFVFAYTCKAIYGLGFPFVCAGSKGFNGFPLLCGFAY